MLYYILVFPILSQKIGFSAKFDQSILVFSKNTDFGLEHTLLDMIFFLQHHGQDIGQN